MLELQSADFAARFEATVTIGASARGKVGARNLFVRDARVVTKPYFCQRSPLGFAERVSSRGTWVKQETGTSPGGRNATNVEL
jgi:hypothetical protein